MSQLKRRLSENINCQQQTCTRSTVHVHCMVVEYSRYEGLELVAACHDDTMTQQIG